MDLTIFRDIDHLTSIASFAMTVGCVVDVLKVAMVA